MNPRILLGVNEALYQLSYTDKSPAFLRCLTGLEPARQGYWHTADPCAATNYATDKKAEESQAYMCIRSFTAVTLRSLFYTTPRRAAGHKPAPAYSLARTYGARAVPPSGFEPLAFPLGEGRSILLSYGGEQLHYREVASRRDPMLLPSARANGHRIALTPQPPAGAGRTRDTGILVSSLADRTSPSGHTAPRAGLEPATNSFRRSSSAS